MKTIAMLLVICATALFLAGCTTPVPPAPATTVPTVPPSSPDLVPLPTSVVPPFYAVSVQVLKNTISTNPYISVTFEGGQGLGFATLMEGTVIRSDGLIEMKSAQNPGIGTQLLFNGTTRTDRVIVNVTYVNGQTYTVKDDLVPFQNINPTPVS
jgi:PBP1b-binding outer membrane lipoprotein LpoB